MVLSIDAINRLPLVVMVVVGTKGDTDAVGQEGLTKPAQLRRMNEVQR